MLIRHLDFFVTLAEEQHFGRASQICGVSQPALSLAIRKLEEDLGATLILRGKRFIGLTAEGQKTLTWGRQILSDYSHLRDDLVGSRKGGLTGCLRLATIPEAMPLIPAISARFEKRNPLARINIVLKSASEIQSGIEHFDLDGGLTLIRARPPAGMTAVPMGVESLRFACHKDHPFAPDPVIPWQDAITQLLCITEGLASLPATRGLRPAITCASLDGVLAHLRAGFWCAIVPAGFQALLARNDDIVLRILDDAAPRLPMAVLMKKRDPQSPMVQALADCIATLAAPDGDEANLSPPG